MVKRKVMVNERGVRIGDGHHKAVLTDAEVAQLLTDRGPDDAPSMTYLQLAKRYGVSKGCVASIVSGRTRGLQGQVVLRSRVRKPHLAPVRVTMTMDAADRARLHRLGGSRFVLSALETAGSNTLNGDIETIRSDIAEILKRLIAAEKVEVKSSHENETS